MEMQETIYTTWIKRHFSAVIGLISALVTFFVDHAGEIAIRALPVVAPFPNAIGMYQAAQTGLHFSSVQAFMFAAAIEISIFALAEIAVTLWDEWQKGDAAYEKPFKLMALTTVFVAVLIIVLVATLEVAGASGHWILAVLPLISVASAIGLCMKRYQKRRSESKQRTLQDSINDRDATIAKMSADIVALNGTTDSLRNDVLSERNFRQDETQRFNAERVELTAQIAALKSTIDALKQSQVIMVDRRESPIVDANNDDDFTSKMLDGKRKKAYERQTKLLSILSEEFDGSDISALNKTQLGTRLGTTRQTVDKDLEALSNAGLIVLNGHVIVK